MRKCKACAASVMVSENEIDEMLNLIVNGNQFELTSGDIYENV